jgi:hypothetical protein
MTGTNKEQSAETQLESIKTEITRRSDSILAAVSAQMITDNSTYCVFDMFLVYIGNGRKQIADKLDPMIKPIREGLDRLYKLRRDLMGPFDQAEEIVKGKMAGWQESERRRIAEEERKAREEQERQERAQREAEEAARKAKSEAERQAASIRMAQAQENLTRAHDRLVTATNQRPVKASGSKVTVKKTWEVEDFDAFFQAVVAGQIPKICIQVNEEVMDTYWASDRGIVLSWPGLKMVEKTIIGGK